MLFLLQFPPSREASFPDHPENFTLLFIGDSWKPRRAFIQRYQTAVEQRCLQLVSTMPFYLTLVSKIVACLTLVLMVTSFLRAFVRFRTGGHLRPRVVGVSIRQL